MSSIDSQDIVLTILKNGGQYPGDPACHSVFLYGNMFGGETYKLCYSAVDEKLFLETGMYQWARPLFQNGQLTEEGQQLVTLPRT